MSVFDDISVVLVTYNSTAVIEQCLASVAEAANIIVVDNGSIDDTVAQIRSKFPNVRIIARERNLGFGAGVNAGIRHVTTPYVLLTAPDVVCNGEAVGELRRALDQYHDAAFVVPLLRVPRQGIETWVMGPHEMRQSKMSGDLAGPFCTWFTSAAAGMFRTEAFRRLQGFDENIFLYQEDLDLSLRIRAIGLSQIILPSVVVDHINSGSAPRSRRLHWRKDWNFAWSHLYVVAKHVGADAARAEAWRLLRRYGPKALFYFLTLNAKRFTRDFAAFHGTISYLLGGQPKRSR